MTAFDFSPLFRSTVGFDRLARLAEASARADSAYPPTDIVRTGKDAYAITLAVAGFEPDDLSIEVKDALLTITGRKQDKAAGEETEVLYRGIAQRDFARRFTLADHVKVRDAALSNGLLTISLIREVPEAAKPRAIPITAPTATQASTQHAA